MIEHVIDEVEKFHRQLDISRPCLAEYEYPIINLSHQGGFNEVLQFLSIFFSLTLLYSTCTVSAGIIN